MHSLRSALRTLARAKGLTVVLLVSLALGTGANVAVLGVLDALLFSSPDGVTGADRLVSLHTSQYSGASYGPSSFADVLSLQASIGTLDSAAAFETATVNVGLATMSQAARVAEVSPGFFPTLGMTASAGRLDTAESGDEATAPAVVSEALWRSLGGTAATIGGVIRVGGRDYRVTGIAPPGFRGLSASRPVDVWIPLRGSTMAGGRGDRRFEVVGRLAAGATLDETNRDLADLAVRLAAEHPATNRGAASSPDAERRMTAVPYSRLDSSVRSAVSLVGGLILAAAALLLASAAVNAGTLLLSRAMSRQRELAVKRALGATRGLLARQLLLEALLISIAGVASGLLAAAWLLDAMPRSSRRSTRPCSTPA